MDVNELKLAVAKAVESFAVSVAEQAEETVKARLLASLTGAPVKSNGNGIHKRRGRPVGSKNKPKATKAEATAIVASQKATKTAFVAKGKKCLDPDCDGKPVLAKGLCRSHYYKGRREAKKGQAANGATATPAVAAS